MSDDANTFLGYPVFTDPEVARLAANSKVIDPETFAAYYIRDIRALFEDDE